MDHFQPWRDAGERAADGEPGRSLEDPQADVPALAPAQRNVQELEIQGLAAPAAKYFLGCRIHGGIAARRNHLRRRLTLEGSAQRRSGGVSR